MFSSPLREVAGEVFTPFDLFVRMIHSRHTFNIIEEAFELSIQVGLREGIEPPCPILKCIQCFKVSSRNAVVIRVIVRVIIIPFFPMFHGVVCPSTLQLLNPFK